MDYFRQNPIIESEDGKWILFHRPQHLIIFDRQTGDCMIDALYMTDEEQGSALIPQTTENMDRPEEKDRAMDFLLDRIERVQGMNHN